MKFYLVAEGSTDQPIFERAVKTWCGKSAEVILLEPVIDATTKNHKAYGYQGVISWCRLERGYQGINIKRKLHFQKADAFIIHLDADIAEALSSHMKTQFPPSMDRAKWVEKLLADTLGKLMQELPIILVVPKMMTETWLLSTYNRKELANKSIIISDYEDYPDIGPALLAMGYPESKRRQGKLKKNEHLYRNDPKYAPRLERHIERIENECSQFKDFKDKILSISNKTG